MIHAYQEIYVNNVQRTIGEAFDYAVHTCDISGENFVRMFIASTICQRIEKGDPVYVAGKSGIELAIEIISEATEKEVNDRQSSATGRSPEYWCGWAIAYYQWYSGRKFSEIFKVITFRELESMYSPLHEADITKFVDIIDCKIREYYAETNLKRLRLTYGCTQAELAKRSGVSLRSIQMYEQRYKDINKASAESVYRLAMTLGCTVEDLIER